MISKLPRWAWVGAPLLTFSAGMVNGIGFLSMKHQGITHLTGTTSLTGLALGDGDMATALHHGTIMLSFLIGAAFSGALIHGTVLTLGRRYGIALFLEAVFLTVAARLLQRDNVIGVYVASAACGLQNAMVSTYSGATLRTTHVSGIFTDLGIFCGHVLRGGELDWRKFRLWTALLSAFLTGGAAAAVAFRNFAYEALYIPALICITLGLAYAIYYRVKFWLQKRAQPQSR
jgi:uncharacterized membrane protein YoaK (UPF0700 family)